MTAWVDSHEAYGALKSPEEARRIIVHLNRPISGHGPSNTHFKFLPEFQETKDFGSAGKGIVYSCTYASLLTDGEALGLICKSVVSDSTTL